MDGGGSGGAGAGGPECSANTLLYIRQLLLYNAILSYMLFATPSPLFFLTTCMRATVFATPVSLRLNQLFHYLYHKSGISPQLRVRSYILVGTLYCLIVYIQWNIMELHTILKHYNAIQCS